MVAVLAALALALTGSVQAKGKGGPKTFQGTVEIVRKDGIKVNFGENKPLDVFGQRGPNTVVTANGSPATWDDIEKGQYVSITVQGGMAISIDIGGGATATPTKSKSKSK
jgi:hypothetical protein